MTEITVTNQNGEVSVLGRKAYFNSNQQQININLNVAISMQMDRTTKVIKLINDQEIGEVDLTDVKAALEVALTEIDTNL